MRFKLLVGAISLFLSSILFISLVNADPGISVTITDVDMFITSLGDTATYAVNAESITTEDENVKLTVSGDPNLNFDWTTQEFLLLAGDTQSFGLEAAVTTFTAGDYEFTVLGEAWPILFPYDEALMMGLIETSSFTDYVHVTVVAAPTVESCDSTGTKKDTFFPGEDVYAVGEGYKPLWNFTIHVVEDVTTWTDGMAIPSRVPGTAFGVSSDSDGNMGPWPVWGAPLTIGKYDIVVDVNWNGIYDEGIDALDDSDIEVTAGFQVIPEVPLGTVMASAAMIIALVSYIALPRQRRRP